MQGLFEKILGVAKGLNSWNDVMDCIAETFQVTSVSLLAMKDFNFGERILCTSEIARPGGELSNLRELIETSADEDDREAYRLLLQLPTGQMILETEAFGVESTEQLPPSTFRDASLKAGMYQRGVVILNNTGPWLDGIFFQFRSLKEVEHLRATDPSDLRNLFWLIAASLANTRIENAIFGQIRPFQTMLEKFSLPAFVVTQDGRIVFQNKLADVVLQPGRGLKVTPNGTITPQWNDNKEALNNLIKTTCSKRTDNPSGTPSSSQLILRSENPLMPEVVSAVPILNESDFGGPSAAACLLIVSGEGVSCSTSSTTVASIAGLTNVETKTFELLAKGHSANEIAEQRNVSLQTVRTQIKSVYAKVRCKSQPELMRMAAMFELPV